MAGLLCPAARPACPKKRSSKCVRFLCTFGGLDENAKQKHCAIFGFHGSPKAATPYNVIFILCIYGILFLGFNSVGQLTKKAPLELFLYARCPLGFESFFFSYIKKTLRCFSIVLSGGDRGIRRLLRILDLFRRLSRSTH